MFWLITSEINVSSETLTQQSNKEIKGKQKKKDTIWPTDIAAFIKFNYAVENT